MKNVTLKELPVTAVEKPECYRNGDQLVLLLNGKAYALSSDAATELMFRMCAELEGARPC